MKQTIRAGIMRIISDLIKADGIIDSREMYFLDTFRSKYGIKREDEILSASYTFAKAVDVLMGADDALKCELMDAFTEVAMSDNFCAKAEALLLLALRYCLTTDADVRAHVISLDTSNIRFDDRQMLYVESEYNVEVNAQIQNYYREIRTELRLAGFDFVYFPEIAERYSNISDMEMIDVLAFLYPKVSIERLNLIVSQLRRLSTAEFCKTQLAAKMGAKEFECIEPSVMIKVGDSIVDDKRSSNFLAVEVCDNALTTIRTMLDQFLESYQCVNVSYVSEEKGRFVFTGYYKQVFDILMLRKGIRSTIVIDPYKEQIMFPEADARIEHIHRREKALYALFLLEASTGGINFNKPADKAQYARYERRMENLMCKYRRIYRMFGGEEDKAPNIVMPDIRLPMISLLKRQILKLGDILYNVEDYTVQRNVFGNYGINLPQSSFYCCDRKNGGVIPLSESEEWGGLAAFMQC